MTITQARRDALYPQETGDDVVLLLLIEHDDLDAPIRLSDAGGVLVEDPDTYTIDAFGETWVSADIAIELPDQSEETPRARLTVPNVDTRIGEAVDTIHTPATCTIWGVLASDPDVIVAGPHSHLKLRLVNGNALAVEGDLTRTELSREPWPKDTISLSRFVAARKVLDR